MPKYEKQNETFFETKDGWYVFRDLQGDGYGQYLYKVFQYTEDDPKIFSKWIDPVPVLKPVGECFGSKDEAIKAMAEAA